MKRSPFFAVAALLLLAAAARASDPVGIYAVIDKVVLEPGEDSPERIQVWGVFTVAQGGSGDDYGTATRGYLYYSLNKDKPEVSRKEWADLKKVAGTGQCIAFGSRYKDKGTIRKVDEKPKSPDTYPLGFGLQKVDADHPQVKKLKEAASRPAEKKEDKSSTNEAAR